MRSSNPDVAAGLASDTTFGIVVSKGFAATGLGSASTPVFAFASLFGGGCVGGGGGHAGAGGGPITAYMGGCPYGTVILGGGFGGFGCFGSTFAVSLACAGLVATDI